MVGEKIGPEFRAGVDGGVEDVGEAGGAAAVGAGAGPAGGVGRGQETRAHLDVLRHL